MAAPGPLVASGRDADVYDIGGGRVLRRYRRPGPTEREAMVMTHARAHGFPVPEVFSVDETDMVMERLDGPTMLADLGRRPWRLRAHAHTLADLHRRLHRVPAPDGLPARGGDRLVHLDLHPDNVILTPDGPVVIDWPNATGGTGAFDVTFSWVTMAVFGVPTDGVDRAVAAIGRWLFVRSFLSGFDAAELAPHLPAVLRLRMGDRNTTEAERARLGRWLARVAP